MAGHVEVAALPVATASEPRLFPPLEGPGVRSIEVEPDGSQQLVSYGLRVLVRPSGAVDLAREYLVDQALTLKLPPRLGGGFLIYVCTPDKTLLYRATTFTGELKPLARLEFRASQVQPGFDRLYVADDNEQWIALDATTGAALGLGNLPAAPNYRRMAFIDGWFGAVQIPFRDTLVSFDAGISWRPLGLRSTGLLAQNDALAVTSAEGAFLLDRDGVLTHVEADSSEPTVAPAPPRAPAEDAALKLAVLRGFRDRDGSLVVASGGALLRVSPEEGRVLQRDAHAYPGSGECTALRFEAGFGFACGEGTEQTTLYAYEPSFSLRPARVFAGAHYVASSGNGALVIRADCSGRSVSNSGYCLVDKHGAARQLRVQGDRGVERVLALADGRAAVLIPPRLGAAGLLSLVDAQQREQRVPLKLPLGPTRRLLESGLWLDGVRELPDGRLAGWVAGSESLIGVRVALDGTVSVGHSQGSIEHSLLSGTHALIVEPTGRAVESSDGGFVWSPVELPPAFDASVRPRGDDRVQGCSELGCAFSGFVRVGWRRGVTPPRLAFAPIPEVTRLLQPGGDFWRLRCERTGEVSRKALPVPPARWHAAGSGRWVPFLQFPAPPLAPGEVGYATGSRGTESAYVWGDRHKNWREFGHLMIRALDPFRVEGGLLQSAVVRSPWPDAVSAAQAVGGDSADLTTWNSFVDGEQRSAMVSASLNGTSQLFFFDDRRGVTLIHPEKVGLVSLVDVAKVGAVWYAITTNPAEDTFRLSSIVGDQVEHLAEHSLGHVRSVQLARSVSGDALAVWAKATDWYLFPVATKTGELSAPLTLSAADLAKVPPVCASDADGFVLTARLSLSPTLTFPDEGPLNLEQVQVRLVWSAQGLCVRGLAALTDQSLHPARPSTPSVVKVGAAIPLVVTEFQPEGRRYGFACTR